MNPKVKHYLFNIIKLLLIGIIIYCVIYFILTIYTLITFSNGCGFDDGPFEAKKISAIKIQKTDTQIKLDTDAFLTISNRVENSQPIITFREQGKTKWTVLMDLGDSELYRDSKIEQIRNVKILKNSRTIKLQFLAKWTYGEEQGSMKINRKNGKNHFCLS